MDTARGSGLLHEEGLEMSARQEFLTRKDFLHNFFPRVELVSVTGPGGRFYTTPEGIVYPSVTTVLSTVPDDDPNWREKWVSRVGEEEADRVTERGKSRGSLTHKIVEKYLLNDPNHERGAMPVHLVEFRKLKPHLDRNVGSIYGIEFPLWSHHLRTAGRADGIAGWKGWNSILDWKTSARPKTKEMIKKYFLQASCYAMMAEERLGLNIPQIVIGIMVDHDHPQIYEESTDTFREEVESLYTQRVDMQHEQH